MVKYPWVPDRLHGRFLLRNPALKKSGLLPRAAMPLRVARLMERPNAEDFRNLTRISITTPRLSSAIRWIDRISSLKAAGVLLPPLFFFSGCFETAGPVPGFRGTVVYQDGHPLDSGKVRLRPADYLPGKGRTGISETPTDINGMFGFPKVDVGHYRIEAVGVSKYRAVLDWNPRDDGRIDTVYLVMDWSAAVSGTVRGNDQRPVGGRVQVFGLDLETRIDAGTGNFFLDTLPLGIHRLHIVTLGMGEKDIPGVSAMWEDTTRLGIITLGE